MGLLTSLSSPCTQIFVNQREVIDDWKLFLSSIGLSVLNFLPDATRRHPYNTNACVLKKLSSVFVKVLLIHQGNGNDSQFTSTYVTLK